MGGEGEGNKGCVLTSGEEVLFMAWAQEMGIGETDEEDFAATNDDDEFSRKRRQIADIIDIIYISDDES